MYLAVGCVSESHISCSLRFETDNAVGTFGVWYTGVLLDCTENDWSYVFTIIASINVFGALAFLWLFDSKREFD